MKTKTTLDSKMEVALNTQINAELWSSYLYLSMSYDMKNKGFEGMAKWFAFQSEEEFNHAKKMMEYVIVRDGKVKLGPIAEVRQEWNSPIDVFEDTLMHEKLITEKINSLMELAVQIKDYPTQNMLNWFIDEQVEEEDNARKNFATLKKIQKDVTALFIFDNSLMKRGE